MAFVLGLTGSIGTGKTTTAAMFRQRGVPVHDADQAVHALYSGVAVPPIEAAFPGTVVEGVVDRTRLGARVLGDAEALGQLESIVHPLVREAERAFLLAARKAGASLVVLDVPLLLETGGEARCDAVLVVTVSSDEQRRRILARPGTDTARMEAILARQMPDAEKRRRAHFIVDTGSGFAHAERAVSGILRALAGRPGQSSCAPSDPGDVR